MPTFVAASFLTPIVTLLARPLRSFATKILAARPELIFAIAALVAAWWLAIASALHALSAPVAILIAIYTMAPAACAYAVRRQIPPAWMDFAIVLLLWFPLEFSAGAAWIPKPAQGLLHLAAYGVALLLALVLFLLFRRAEGIKYQLPASARDRLNLLAGFAVAAPLLIAVGRSIGFLGPFHLPHLSSARLATQFLLILAATALPEEILFRGLIQNFLMQKLGEGFPTLLLAGLIFGCAHLDNGPGPLPNWRYMMVATIAGVIYGKVFEKSSSILASAGLHALVNTVKHNCF